MNAQISDTGNNTFKTVFINLFAFSSPDLAFSSLYIVKSVTESDEKRIIIICPITPVDI